MIGTLGEKSLHAALKIYYVQPGDQIERNLDGYVVDIFRPADEEHACQCIEIQTRGLGRLKPKLAVLLERYPVRLVYPVAQERFIVRIDTAGEVLSRRKSPKRGSVFHLFPELVGLPALVTHPHFSVEVALIREEEFWMDDGRGSWRRKRWSIYDRHLLGVAQTVPLLSVADYVALLPAGLPETFGSQDLAQALGLSRSLAQKMIYCLFKMGGLQVAGKQGRAVLYRL